MPVMPVICRGKEIASTGTNNTNFNDNSRK
jgi:hypothetical protein